MSVELVLCPLTLRSKVRSCTPVQYREILDIAVEHGYSGVALGILDVEIAAADGISTDAFLAEFERRGLRTPLVEAVSGWGQGASESEIEALTRPTLELAERAGAETVVAISMEPTIPSLAVAARGFAHVCRLAGARGLKVSVEFFPWGGISDLATARQLIELAGEDNGGIVFDMWHWGRSAGGFDYDSIRKIPGERFHVVQLDDAGPKSGPAGREGARETLTARLLPGEGVVDIVGALRTIKETGAQPLLAPEVFSQELFALGASEMARRVAGATRRTLAEAGFS